MNSTHITEADLHAYVDGRLSLARQAEIASYLALHPAELERVHAYRAQQEQLHALFDPVLEEPVPGHWVALLRKPLRRSGNWLNVQRFAAAAVIAFLGGVTGWVMHGAMPAGSQHNLLSWAAPGNSGLAHQAAIAHVVYSPDMRRPVEIGAEQEDQLVTWLSKRLGTPIRPPKLGKLGYELIGGRLLPGESGPVAQFMYHNSTGQRLTLYVSNEQSKNHDTGFRFAQEGPVNVFYWIDGKFGYALSAGINKGELAKVAAIVYEQLQDPI